MDYSIDTPFSTYEEIQSAISSGKAKLSYDRTTAFNIACRVNQRVANTNFIILPLASIVAMLIACKLFSVSKWVLLFALSSIVFIAIVPHMKRLLTIIGIALIALPFIVFHNSAWMIAIGAGIIGMIIGYDIWWGIISSTAHSVLMSNEELFESVWKSGKIAIKTDNTIDGFYTYGSAEVREIRKKYNL